MSNCPVCHHPSFFVTCAVCGYELDHSCEHQWETVCEGLQKCTVCHVERRVKKKKKEVKNEQRATDNGR